jgi:hypothetical protein
LCRAAPLAAVYDRQMRRIAPLLLVLIAAALAACGDVVIGPVDHSCANRPDEGSDGSGCGGANGR